MSDQGEGRSVWGRRELLRILGTGAAAAALPRVAAVFYRPVRIGEIVEKVNELLARGQAA